MSTTKRAMLTKEEYLDAFNGAAADNKSYLLILEKIREEVVSIEIETYVRSVKDFSEIVPLLKSLNTLPFDGDSTSLVGVLDLRKNFEAALSANQPLAAVLDSKTVADIAQYKKEYGHQRELQAWESRPWIQKIFIPKPVLEQ